MAKKIVKKWYKSRMMWAGLLPEVAGVLMLVSQFLAQEISLEACVMGGGSILFGIAIQLLRLDTKDPITLK